ncbi:unnamed protein product [Medioppia subpectinata]|uniref:PDZ domain-containing protein n=1 Tax=Medioppia subpectinata TaxID=1979941 RepID=A0A7R9KPJ3_9ACAR|nr:unnamed protein product [Medioppia subpectinata]CAG2107441.1 unnamed protein product [Medioppia subpectinata]
METLDADEHWEYEAINLSLRKAGLGMSIKGGLDSPDSYDSPHIYVSKVFTDGMAYADGRLQLGDIILSVNGFPLIDVMHFEAVDAIISAGTDITLYCKRKRCRIYDRIPTPPITPTPPATPTPPDTPIPLDTPIPPGVDPIVDEVDGLMEVRLDKGSGGFGVCISGGVDNEHRKGDGGVYVTKVVPNGVADRDGRLAKGDQLLAINDVSLESVTYEEAVAAMRNSPPMSVLTVFRKL